MDEFDRIARFFKPLASNQPGSLSLSDDAAILTIEPGKELVVCADAMVEGVHFLPGMPPDRLAAKLLAVNLSDLAAMGASPYAYLLTLALPKTLEEDWLAGFSSGLAKMQNRWKLDLIGGDSVSIDGPVTGSLTALGTVEAGKALRRSGARAGDGIYVTGTIGDAVLGLGILRDECDVVPEATAKVLIDRYEAPEPRIEIGLGLVGLASAAIDVSDGLLADIGHIASASGVGARILAESVPRSEHADRLISVQPERQTAAMTGGDDYELAFTASPREDANLKSLSERTGVAITKIGTIVDGKGTQLLDADGRAMEVPRGWRHF